MGQRCCVIHIRESALAYLPEDEALSASDHNISFIRTLRQLEAMESAQPEALPIDCEGLETGIHAVGAPLFRLMKAVASLAIAGPRFNDVETSEDWRNCSACAMKSRFAQIRSKYLIGQPLLTLLLTH